MDCFSETELDQIVNEVFWKEDRQTAELRLFPTDAEMLSKVYSAKCLLIDHSIHADGKRWYRVWIPIQSF